MLGACQGKFALEWTTPKQSRLRPLQMRCCTFCAEVSFQRHLNPSFLSQYKSAKKANLRKQLLTYLLPNQHDPWQYIALLQIRLVSLGYPTTSSSLSSQFSYYSCILDLYYILSYFLSIDRIVSYYIVMNLSLMDDQRVLQASGLAAAAICLS